MSHAVTHRMRRVDATNPRQQGLKLELVMPDHRERLALTRPIHDNKD